MTPWLLSGTTFLASAVEMVEAATIVLAVAVTQGWRVAVYGSVAAAVALAVLVAVFTPILTNAVSLERLEVIVGPFLILFGTGWLRKAVWRYAGRKSLHDEAALYAHQIESLRARERRHGFAVAFQGVFVEGLEVAVIVVTLAASTPALLQWSIGGAVCAFAVVAAAAVALRAPFSRVPENLLKAVVGIMLLSLGTYWTGEGAHLEWWFGDSTLFALIAGYLMLALALVALQRQVYRARS